MKVCISTTPIRPDSTEFPPFGSMAIIQSLRTIGIEADFYHIDYHRYSDEKIKNYFAKNQFDIVGISAVVSTAYKFTKKLTSIIKKTKPDTIVIVGGGLATSAKILHEKCSVDYCVLGDGEKIICNLVRLIQNQELTEENLNKCKGISFYNSKNQFIFTGYDSRPSADEIPFPDYTILEKIGCLDHYIQSKPFWMDGYGIDYDKNGKKSATIITTKGCVARCTFCHRFEKGYRVRPVLDVIEHIKDLKNNYNVGYLSIADENFGSNKTLTKQLVKYLGSTGIKWRAGGVRAYTVDLETLKFWKQNGCEMVIYGIESGSPTMLKVMEKKVTLEQNINALKWAYEADLATVIQLVIGMPGETDKTIQETIDFLKKTWPYYSDCFRDKITVVVSPNYAQSLPGTPLYEYARKNNFIQNDIDGEEEYLIKISDTDAYQEDHFINYTKQPLLKVLSWRYWIKFEIFKCHLKYDLKISSNIFIKFYSLIIIICKLIFKKFKIDLEYTSPIEKKLNELGLIESEDGYFNIKNNFYYLMYIVPWNRFTYPILCIIIGMRFTKGLNRKLFLMVVEHIKFSFISKNIQLPKESLRKLVNITDDDAQLRIGR